MILRPIEDGYYIFVDESYVHGLMDAEALLGPLPSGLTQMKKLGNLYNLVFVDSSAGQVYYEAPRLGPLLEGWEQPVDPEGYDSGRHKETREWSIEPGLRSE